MTHKFNHKHKDKLHAPERMEAMPPRETLISLGLKEGDIFVDVGCGTGYFIVGAVPIIGDMSKIYALDTSREMLKSMEEHLLNLSLPDLDQLNTVQTDEYSFKLPDNSSTFCLLSFVLHEVDDKRTFLLEAKRILKPGGTLAVIEWEKKPTTHGPPLEHRVEMSHVEKWLEEADLSEVKSRRIGTDYYAVTGRTA